MFPEKLKLWFCLLTYSESSRGVFLHGEKDYWSTMELRRSLIPGAMNTGIGVDYLFFEERAHSSFVIGTSTLLSDTWLDKSGETGVFVEIRPLGYRWNVWKYLYIDLDPISFSFINPVMGDIPIVLKEYRTILSLEGSF